MEQRASDLWAKIRVFRIKNARSKIARREL